MKRLVPALIAAVLGLASLANPGLAGSPAGELRDLLAAGKFGNFTFFDEPRPVSEVRFTDGEGRDLSLDRFRGKVVLLNLWATWCAPCRREMPALDRLQARLGGDDFEVLALAVDRGGAAKVKAFLDELGIERLGLYVDSTTRALRALGAYGLPTTLLIDRAGNEVMRVIGATEWDGAEIVELVRHLIDSSDHDRPLDQARAERDAPN
ncbi:MAG: TlpA disulfide reductase family protein [Alphaproteobacteria bacterium]|nr:TlpA disulfide reductase family protein [Alphaproteobacteria bacterium]